MRTLLLFACLLGWALPGYPPRASTIKIKHWLLFMKFGFHYVLWFLQSDSQVSKSLKAVIGASLNCLSISLRGIFSLSLSLYSHNKSTFEFCTLKHTALYPWPSKVSIPKGTCWNGPSFSKGQFGFVSPNLLKCTSISSSISTSECLSQEKIRQMCKDVRLRIFLLAEIFAIVKIWQQPNINNRWSVK